MARQDYFIKLSAFYRHFSALANNYNQTVKRIHRITDEKRAYYLLKELQKLTAEMAVEMRKIVDLTEEFKQT